MAKPKKDYEFENHFSIWLCRPQNEAARKHLATNVGDEAQWFGDALAVEPRYAEDLRDRLADNGWKV